MSTHTSPSKPVLRVGTFCARVKPVKNTYDLIALHDRFEWDLKAQGLDAIPTFRYATTLFLWIDLGAGVAREHVLRLDLRDPQGVAHGPAVEIRRRVDGSRDSWAWHHPFDLMFLGGQGTYRMKVELDGEVIGSVPFTFVVTPDEQAN